jgi:Raf kinase inhibitor-like YbhB/YbcL family protein
MAFRISSPAFTDGADIPVRHTCDGENLSPQLSWSDVPDGARSLALVVDDPDAPRGTFTHWVLFDIPPDTNGLGEHAAMGTIGIPGRNGFGRSGYGGPCPPPGDNAHRYRFTLYALDVPSLALAANATREDLEVKMQAHVLGTAQLVGKYKRARVSASTRS